MAERLDIVLFGATGFTGKHCIPLIAKFSKIKNRNLTWGVAGRSENKLRDVLNSYEEVECSLQNIRIIIADVQDEESLHSMARQARIIINCCGLFNLYGEAVVKACIEEGTHHVDVSAEVKYMEEMQLKYHQQAEEKGVYIISACGFESIPVDLGVVLLQETFNGTLNSVEAYISYCDGDDVSGPVVNYTSWQTVLHSLLNAQELKSIRKQLFAKQLPNFKPKLYTKLYRHKSNLVDGWVVPFRLADSPVVKRSQRLFYEKESKRPVQIATYFAASSIVHWVLLVVATFILPILAKLPGFVNLLLKYPKLFTLGYVTHQAPNEERIKKSQYSVTLYGKGWKEKCSTPDYQFLMSLNDTITAKMEGADFGYGGTCLLVVLAAIVVLTESDYMPSKGGVLPPGYAFGRTSLLEEMSENGMTFQVIHEKECKRK